MDTVAIDNYNFVIVCYNLHVAIIKPIYLERVLVVKDYLRWLIIQVFKHYLTETNVKVMTVS